MAREKYTPKQLVRQWNTFKKLSQESGTPLYLEGFYSRLGISSTTFYNYSTKEDYSDIITSIKDECKHDLLQRTGTGKTPTSFGIFLLKCNHGMIEESEKQRNEIKRQSVAQEVDNTEMVRENMEHLADLLKSAK